MCAHESLNSRRSVSRGVSDAAMSMPVPASAFNELANLTRGRTSRPRHAESANLTVCWTLRGRPPRRAKSEEREKEREEEKEKERKEMIILFLLFSEIIIIISLSLFAPRRGRHARRDRTFRRERSSNVNVNRDISSLARARHVYADVIVVRLEIFALSKKAHASSSAIGATGPAALCK